MALILREGHMLLVSPFCTIKDKKPGILLVTYLLLFKMIYGHYPFDEWRSINKRKMYQHVAAREYPPLRCLYKELYMFMEKCVQTQKFPKTKGYNFFKNCYPIFSLSCLITAWVSHANLAFKSRHFCFLQIIRDHSLKECFTMFMHKMAESRLHRASYFWDSLPSLHQI